MMCNNPFLTAVLTCSVLFAAMAAQAEYRLDSGDVLEIDVFGVTDFKRHATVNIDGDVSVPFIGEVHASGLTLAELRKRATRELEAKGRIRTPDVTIELIEYRPFYISGDVAHPGAHPYRPALTVRHAIALAGGYDALRFRAENPLLMAPELRSQYESLWLELVKRQARVISLQAQLDRTNQFDAKVLFDAPVSPATVKQIAELETKDLSIRVGDFEKEKEFLSREIEAADKNIAAIEAALSQQDREIRQQEEATQRTAAYHAKGVSPVTRVDEERRALAALHSQQLETMARLAQTRRERAELKRKLDRAADEYAAKLVRDLQDASTESEKIRSQIRGVGEKSLYAGALKAQMQRRGPGPEIMIYRKIDGKQISLPATESSDIEPGDVVDVLVRPDQLVLTPSTVGSVSSGLGTNDGIAQRRAD